MIIKIKSKLSRKTAMKIQSQKFSLNIKHNKTSLSLGEFSIVGFLRVKFTGETSAMDVH